MNGNGLDRQLNCLLVLILENTHNIDMLSREDFIFTIGYNGPAAIVDNQAKKKYGKLSAGELAERGFFRAAYSSALYSNDPNELTLVAESYKKQVFSAADSTEIDASFLSRLFGVSRVDVKRTILI